MHLTKERFLDNLFALSPDLILILGCLFILVYGVFLERYSSNNTLIWDSKIYKYNATQLLLNLTIILIVIQIPFIWNTVDGSFFENQIINNSLVKFFKTFLSLITIGLILLSKRFLIDDNLKITELGPLFILLLLGMYAMVCSNDFLVMFLGIELASLTLYLLAAIKTDSNYSSEAAMKYFILGAVASGLIGFGISIVYTSTGTINFTNLKLLFLDLGQLDYNPLNEFEYYKMCYNRTLTGLVLIILGIFCKLAAAPFHMWAPDVYEGVPTIITTIYATLPKIAFVGLIINLYINIFVKFKTEWILICLIIGTVSIVWGSLGAIGQKKIKRLIAYSSITNVGFMIIAIAHGGIDGITSLVFYLFIYIVSTLGLMSYILNLRHKTQFFLIKSKPGEKPIYEKKSYELKTIDQLNNIFPRWKISMFFFITILLSIAGIPPLAGFFSKLLVIYQLIMHKQIALAIFIIFISGLSSFYYIRLIKNLVFKPKNYLPKPIIINRPSFVQSYILSIATIMNLSFVFIPWFYIDTISFLVEESIL